jgi:fucose permease
MAVPPPRTAHRAAQAAYFVFGVVMAIFGVHVPSLRAHYGLDDGQLALALLGVAAGAVLCLASAGRLIGAFGARRVAAVAALAMCAALAALLEGRHPVSLGAAVVIFGAAVGLFDVAINSQGTRIESLLGRPVMSALHGLWSLGGTAGAALGAWMIDHGMPATLQLRWVAGVAAVLCLVASAGLLPRESASGAQADAAQGWRRMPPQARRVLLALGLLALLGLLAEGAIYDWVVLFLQRERGADPALAALGFSAFSAAMAAGRFGGDWLRARVAAARLLAASAALSAASMAVVLASGSLTIALAGLIGVGLGLSNVIPILFVAASRVEGASAAAGIALVSSLGWLGIVAGPPLVGGVAQATSLTVGLALVVVASLALAGCARVASPGGRLASSPP